MIESYHPSAPPLADVAAGEAAGRACACRKDRFASGFLDYVFVYLPIGIAAGVAGAFSLQTALVAEAIMWLAMSTVQWVLIVKRGQTIGKRITRSQIVRLDGSAAGLVHGVVLRGIVPLFMLFVALGGLALVGVGTQGLVLGMFLGPVADAVFVLLPGKRALRDYVAGTEVIALATRAQSPSPAPLVSTQSRDGRSPAK